MSALTLLAYGADWSARPIYGPRLTQSVNRANGQRFPVELVLRYANFNGQGLSYLDKAEYRSHLTAGKRSYLIFQKGTADPAGGAAGGRAFGAEAVAYARYLGYQLGDPIFFCADGWTASKGYSVETAMAFFRETTRVVNEAGFAGGVYGFADVILTAHDRGIGDVHWLCGDRVGLKRPNGEAVGIHLYQWNNGRVHIEADPGVWVECDLVEQYEPIGEDMPSAQDIANAILDTWLEDKRPDVPDGERHHTQVRNALWSGWHTIHFGDEGREGVGGLYPSHRDIVAAIEANAGKVTLDEAQLAALMENFSELFDALGEHLAPKLGVSKALIREALSDFYRAALVTPPPSSL